MIIRALFDSNGLPTGFYPIGNGVDYSAVDFTGAVGITETDRQAFIDNAGQRAWVNGAVVPYEPPAPSLAAVRQTRIAELSAACATAIVSGFPSSALGAPHTYPSKPTDQANMLSAVMASLLPGLPANWTTPFWIEDSSGAWSFVEHTAAQIQQAGSDGKTSVATAQLKLTGLTTQVMAATTTAAVAAIGW